MGLDVNAYYALGVPAYMMLMLGELAVTRRRGTLDYGWANALGNLSGGMGEVLIGLFLGPYLFALYDFTYQNFALVRWPEGSWVPWVLALFLADFCYYCYHRAGHRIGALWAIHGVHHQGEHFNVTLAMRHPWLSDSYSAIFYAPLPLLGVGPVQFFVVITIISFYALGVHTRLWFDRPGFGIFVTPASHIVHHASNRRYLGKNLGAMFTIWDRMFGTHATLHPDDPPRLGTPAGYSTHDGARSQLVFWQDMIHYARQASSWRERLGVFLGRPGHRPPGVAPLVRPPAPADAAIPRAVIVYVTLEFVVASIFALYILWLRDSHPLGVLVISTGTLLWSLSALGQLLDGRRWAFLHEALRLSAATVGCLALAATPGYLAVGLPLAMFCAASLISLGLIHRLGAPHRPAPAPAAPGKGIA